MRNTLITAVVLAVAVVAPARADTVVNIVVDQTTDVMALSAHEMFQFEPQLTLEEFRVWDRELRGDYQFLGTRFDPEEEAATNLREFTAFAPFHDRQMRRLLLAFLANAGLLDNC